MRPFISLCMIVKNEEKVLKRCLDSVAHLVDQIVIIDTGSTDKTKEIAEKFTSHLYDFEWIGDFSAARNFAASKADGEWILVLDADEYVDEENFKEFVQDIKNNQNQFDAYTAKILNFTGNHGESLIQNFHDRIYKNKGEIKYFRKIHEQFKHIEGKELNIKQSKLLIFHSGYLNQVVNEKDKSTRNNFLLDEELRVGLNTAFDYFNYGNEYASKGEYSKALESYLKAYKRKSDYRFNWVSITLVQIIICLMQLKRYNEALKIIEDAENIYSKSAEFLFLKGEIFFLRGQFEDAKQTFHQIIDEPEKYNHIIFRPDLKDQKPFIRLGEIYLYEENYNSAIYYYSSLLNINKYNIESIKKIVIILNKFHSNDEITSFLFTNDLVNQKNLKNYIQACFEVGNPRLALCILNKYPESEKLLNQITRLKIFCVESEGDIKEFEDLLETKVLKNLLDINLINIIDLLLLEELDNEERKLVSKSITLEQNDKLKMLVNLVNGKISVDKLDDHLILFSLKTLLTYKKYSLCNLLLEEIESINQKTLYRVARLLYFNGFKVEALQLYEISDWNDFETIDFIEIIRSLVETNDKDGAIQVAKYASSKFKTDFRFYKFIIENSDDINLVRSTLNNAKVLFEGSNYLEKYDF